MALRRGTPEKLRAALRNECGATLMEMVILITLIAVAIPPIMSLVGYLGVHHAQNVMWLNALHMADSRLEEISAFRYEAPGWASSIEDYEAVEAPSEGYTRTTEISLFTGWGDAGLSGYEVTVTVSHANMDRNFEIQARFTDCEVP